MSSALKNLVLGMVCCLMSAGLREQSEKGSNQPNNNSVLCFESVGLVCLVWSGLVESVNGVVLIAERIFRNSN